ncbi:arsenic metallochaperone ArsD family protein [[Mycoplasma] testudinis]|uniref:arsenic metallochaperone ArsD family protein n=1 Tax=[Mycoplasma] testudinis TaxID=33924 RepID=UPI000486B576|nr:arsenic metallochaperone ArsD family protein [[Mycoplasma] testudinis]
MIVSLYEPMLARTNAGVTALEENQKAIYFALFAFLKENSQKWSATRFNLGNNPEEFEKNSVIANLFKEPTNLPVFLIDNKIVHKGSYLSLHDLRELLNLSTSDIEIIFKNAKKLIAEWNDKTMDFLQDCACV